MSCFFNPTSIANPNPNPNSMLAPHPNTIPNLCPNSAFEFPALERDYMGLGLAGIKQDINDNNIPAPLVHKFSLTDPPSNDHDLCGSHLKLAPPSGADSDDDDDADDGERISANIGWPPISSYRKSTTRGLAMKPPCNTQTITPLIVHEAPLEEENTNNGIDDDDKEAFSIFHMKASLSRKPMHIKVSMDGTPIMRKLDLESMQGYHHLSLELHKLFKFYKRNLSCELGVYSCFKDLNGTSFLLTYKDKDGDWMLVGDTPWETFAQSARRIRIMKKK